MSCFLCCNKFHAVGCTTPAISNICNTSFLQLFRPMSEKSGVNAGRPGNFLFFCDTCMTKFEIDQTIRMEDKLTELQNQMKLMSDDIKSMKENAEVSKSGSIKPIISFAEVTSSDRSGINNKNSTNYDTEISTDKQTSVNVVNSNNDINKLNESSVKTHESSVLVIDELDDTVSEKENMERVEQVVMSNKIPIKIVIKTDMEKL